MLAQIDPSRFSFFSTMTAYIVICRSATIKTYDASITQDYVSASMQAGLTPSKCISETQKAGLVLPVGMVSGIGLAGLTLGGGMGWLMGKYGLTIDDLLAVEMVTADGRVVRASATEHPDLFRAVRGGSGNFGIVTTFELQLHLMGNPLAGMILYPPGKALDVLYFYIAMIRRISFISTTISSQPSRASDLSN